MPSIDSSVLIFFMDGVGLGEDDPAVNPFAAARLPHLATLLQDEKWYVQGRGRLTAARASLVPTDACLGIPGRPQSATGQAAILTGHNVPQLLGEHYGPKPNQAVAAIIRQGSLFHDVVRAGGTAALLTPYPQRFFDNLASGKRLLSAVPLAVTDAGLPLMTADDLRAGRAVSPDFTAQAWPGYLGYPDMPVLTAAEAGRKIAQLAQAYTFSFFEHWPTDLTGHRESLARAVEHLEVIDAALGGLFAAWDDESGLLILTSDHGNIEEKDHRQHTTNPVPTILVGRGHAELAAMINDLADIAAVARKYLEIGD